VIYYPQKDEIHWKILNFEGSKSYSMNCSVEFFSIRDEVNFQSALKKPISVWFQIPYYTVSGLQVRYLKVQFKKLDIQAMPFVRYYTQAKDYQIRL
jgi:AP-1 complex subunit mu